MDKVGTDVVDNIFINFTLGKIFNDFKKIADDELLNIEQKNVERLTKEKLDSMFNNLIKEDNRDNRISGADMILKLHQTFKLKKRNIKSRSSGFKRNTKVLVYLFKDCIPISASFGNVENDNPRENGYKYTVNVTYSPDSSFQKKV